MSECPGVAGVSYSQYVVWNEQVDLTHDMSCVIFQLEALLEVGVFDLSSGFDGNEERHPEAV